MGIIAVSAALELVSEGHAHGSTILNYGDALWWAIATVTTVGYGDKYPVTAGGRGIAVVLMLVGIGLIGVLTATVASYFVEEKADREKAELTDRLDRIERWLTRVLNAPEDYPHLRPWTRANRCAAMPWVGRQLEPYTHLPIRPDSVSFGSTV
jgi:voltage-gated potassium channel